MNVSPRKILCAEGLITSVYREFKKVPDPRRISRSTAFSFTDILMSGFAIFGLKFPSLLQFDEHREKVRENLKTLYHVTTPPSDTYLRERLDELDPTFIRPAFKRIFAHLQRGKCLEEFAFLNGAYLLSIDSTGEFFSDKINCSQCCEKRDRTGNITYYHQMLGACIIHPEKSNVIPLCPENIQNKDGSEKNDCERNAAKRFLADLKREHPHLKVIVVADGFNSNAPFIQLLEEHHRQYILGAKPGDHKFLFDAVEQSEETVYHEFIDDKGFFHQFRYLNNTPLNKSNPEVIVNFLEYMQTTPEGKESRFSWVTNIQITEENAFTIMRGGRARWKIENETFNALKNLGYNFKHNYGHGQKYLATILCLLMMLSFLVDQSQEIACSTFQKAKKQSGSYRSIWEKVRVLFQFIKILSWEQIYQMISEKTLLNTS